MRNKVVFEDKRNYIIVCVENIRISVRPLGFLLSGCEGKTNGQTNMFNALGIQIIVSKQIIARKVWWFAPPPGWQKVNCDGASRGTPGLSSCGGVFRNYIAFVRGSFMLS